MIKIKEVLFSSSQATQEELLGCFKEKYLENRDFVRSSIYWMTNSNEIDDLVQETFLKAWKSFKKFKNNSSFRTWIYRIAMNTTYDYLKKNKASHEEYDESQIHSREAKYEMSDLISKGLMRLGREQREAFVLHYQQGFSYMEIASLLEIPEGTVKSRASNAKKNFVSFLEKNGVRNG